MKKFQEWLQINEAASWGHGGWKIHLRTGTDNNDRDLAYKFVLGLIKQLGKNWFSKKLGGGEPDEKDITIYCGPKSEVITAAKAILQSPLYRLIKEPSAEVLRDDVPIISGTNIYGRFNASLLGAMIGGTQFHQYGCKGHSMLKSFVGRSLTDKNFDKNKACEDSFKLLKTKFGPDFTDQEYPSFLKGLTNA